MAEYKKTTTEAVIHTPTGRHLRPGKTAAWRMYLAWKAAGGVPDPPDPPSVPVDALKEMRDLLDASGTALNAATTLGEAKDALIDLYKALLGRHPDQTTTMGVREKHG